MKYLVTGYSGQLGYDIVEELLNNGKNVDFPLRNSMNITNRENVLNYISESKPDVIFHCAAYTSVNKAEEEKEKCFDVNVNGTQNVIDAASMIGAKVIFLSTDYVFNGEKNGIYDINDKLNPINYYGYSKSCAEDIVRKYSKHFIVRISWVFGINGNNFVKTMLKLAESKNEINVVSDQIGSPTYTKDLAKLLVIMSDTEKYGIYHATNSGFCSWYEFAKYIFESNNIDIKVNPILTKDYPTTTAKRPLNSKLSKKSLIDNSFEELPMWKDAINRYNIELKNKARIRVK